MIFNILTKIVLFHLWLVINSNSRTNEALRMVCTCICIMSNALVALYIGRGRDVAMSGDFICESINT